MKPMRTDETNQATGDKDEPRGALPLSLICGILYDRSIGPALHETALPSVWRLPKRGSKLFI
jgi:hypothetical protein